MANPVLHTSQELVIGIVAPIGTDLDVVCGALSDALKRVNYSVGIIRLSELLDSLVAPRRLKWPKLIKNPEFDRYTSYMDAGNAFRRGMNRGDALAFLAVGAMRRARIEYGNTRRAFILRSLKHPEEVASLRRIYGPAFTLFSVCSPPAHRSALLANRIADAEFQFHTRSVLPKAQTLILRDEAESEDEFGQNVRKAFPLGDFFLNARSPSQVRESAIRIIELLFGNVFHTPNRDEYAMFHAHAAALRSSSLQRQVGAVISTEGGDIIAVGANEVPKPGGGLYWSGDIPDHRDFALGYESNDVLKRRMLSDVIHRLKVAGCLKRNLTNLDTNEVVAQIVAATGMSDAQVLNVIEFGRCVHAEMAAIVDAARRGAVVNGATLFTTTFPCHECARHIVAAGIKRVVYVEPYPKSLVNELYPDSIVVDADGPKSTHVNFEPFVGVAPRRYFDLFSMGEIKRKDGLGKMRSWDGALATPRLGEYSFRTGLINGLTESQEFAAFANELLAKGFGSKVE